MKKLKRILQTGISVLADGFKSIGEGMSSIGEGMGSITLFPSRKKYYDFNDGVLENNEAFEKDAKTLRSDLEKIFNAQ